MLLNKKIKNKHIEQKKNECLLLICEIEKEIERKELLLKKEELHKITKFQLDDIKDDISKLNEMFKNKFEIPSNYFLKSFSNIFKSSDWEYTGKEEKELFAMLSKLNNIIEDIKRLSL